MKQRGFTIVEVMMVVVILGVIAVLASVGVSGYLRHSKTAEATRALGIIETGAKVQFGKNTSVSDDVSVHMFCPTGTMLPPAVPKAQRVKVDSGEWLKEPWKCLGFVLTDPQFYAYTHASNGLYGTSAKYTATANGDLDGDNATSSFKLTARGSQSGEAEREQLTIDQEDE